MRAAIRRTLWILLGLAAVALVGYAFVPKPVEVDLEPVIRGPMRVTVDEEGKTRVQQRYVVSAPLAGHLRRIELKAGDAVVAGETLLARIDPTPPSLLDARTVEEAQARVRAAEAALVQTEPAIQRAKAQVDQAQVDLRRAEQLLAQKAGSQEELERRSLAAAVWQAELRAAEAAREVARFQLAQARAALAVARPGTTVPAAFEIRSPITGQVLRVAQESEAAVMPGTPLLELGDVSALEVVVDVLSREAARLRPGLAADLEVRDDQPPLPGRVRRIEPAGFTKVSALGVEEQRVNVLIDLVDPPPAGLVLGDGYRVDVRIVVWEEPQVLQAPTGALFRHGTGWAAFGTHQDRAVLRPVKVGQMNGLQAQVLDGLSDGEEVIVHPGDKVVAGVRVRRR